MIKKIIKYSILSMVLFSSCTKDDFDILPNYEDTPETAFSTEEGFRNVVDGAYDQFKGGGVFTYYNNDAGSSIIMGDVLADNLILCPSGRLSNRSNYGWVISSQNSCTYLYSAAYNVISRANVVLDNLYRLPSSSFMTNIEAEAKAIRAIAHFDIVRTYSKIPTQSADALNSIGIAYVTTFDPNQKPSRLATVREVYTKIVEDLNFAYANINNDNGQGRLNKLSVLGMLNRVYLYLGDWNKVIETGTQIISQSPSVGTLSNFSSIWKDLSNDGVLFKILNKDSGGDKVTVGVAYNQTTTSGIKSEYVVDYDFYLKFKDADVRKSAYIKTSIFVKDKDNSYMYNNIIKYIGRDDKTTANVVDIKYLRTAEIYLNTAEAYYNMGDNANALALLNTLRSERYSSFVPGAESGAALSQAIQLERRLELAFENDRFYTLKRRGEQIKRSNYGPYADGSGAPQTEERLISATDYRLQLPIPQGALQKNPNLVQNPGY